jgi:3D domain
MVKDPAANQLFHLAVNHRSIALPFFLLLLFCTACAKPIGTKVIETTAYCGCSICCSWERGSWQWLKLDFWNRYVASGARRGAPYNGLTASGTVPYEPEEGLFSTDSLSRPWLIPLRLVLFPWYLLPRDGTVAADTKHYPFGTRMYIPGYGWGTVEDRGSKIKGPDRIDLFFHSHDDALQWGRKKVRVAIEGAR